MINFLRFDRSALLKCFAFSMVFISSFAIASNDSAGFSKIYLAIALTFIGTVIAPIIIERNKTSRSKRILKRIILDDVSSRASQLVAQHDSLTAVIAKCKEDSEYEPVIINNKGLDDYIDWTAEKWLLPEEHSANILAFYNGEAALYQYIDFLFGNSELEKGVSRERRITAMEVIHKDMKDLSIAGLDLITALEKS